MEAAFWCLEHDGQRVSDYVEASIAWREKIGADRLRKEDVIDQGKKGAIIVKGHDRSRCQNRRGDADVVLKKTYPIRAKKIFGSSLPSEEVMDASIVL